VSKPKSKVLGCTTEIHPYPCSYYGGDQNEFATVSEFLAEFRDAPVDYNQCVAFEIDEIKEGDPSLGLQVSITMLRRRKGNKIGILIRHYDPKSESAALMEYLKRHWEFMCETWKPVSP
jgi:hypothetical protein